MTDAGCHCRVRAPPRPVALFLRFRQFEREGTPCVTGGMVLGGGRQRWVWDGGFGESGHCTASAKITHVEYLYSLEYREDCGGHEIHLVHIRGKDDLSTASASEAVTAYNCSHWGHPGLDIRKERGSSMSTKCIRHKYRP